MTMAETPTPQPKLKAKAPPRSTREMRRYFAVVATLGFVALIVPPIVGVRWVLKLEEQGIARVDSLLDERAFLENVQLKLAVAEGKFAEFLLEPEELDSKKVLKKVNTQFDELEETLEGWLKNKGRLTKEMRHSLEEFQAGVGQVRAHVRRLAKRKSSYYAELRDFQAKRSLIPMLSTCRRRGQVR
jgi:hypothetical protein